MVFLMSTGWIVYSYMYYGSMFNMVMQIYRHNQFSNLIQKYFVNPKGKVVVCLAADLKKPRTVDTLLLKNSLMKRMLRVLHNILHFMKNPSLHNDLQRFQRSPQNRASLLYQLVELF
ncbi:hypothetical protein ILYODFUR_032696 [Ilyodon furcidens]|uniref:Uncharacterized protein n=1 Tax=Ilyodon furcidens TaxID=33524 RepID=A0ABV0U029_9TELE